MGKNLKYWVEKDCQICGSKFWSLIKRNGRFCSNACSTKFTANNPDRISAIKKTKFKKYGNANYVNPEKAKRTSLLKYGVDNPSKSEIIINKIKATNLNKYGTEWSWQSDETKGKIRDFWMVNYNVENPSQCDDIKAVKRASSIIKYGIDNPSKSDVVIDKIKNTNLNRYGDICPLKNPSIRDKMITTNRSRLYTQTKDRLKYRVEFLFSADEYVNTNRANKYKFKCVKCNQEFVDHMDGGRIPRCMDCYPYLNGISMGELDILNYIKSILPNIEVKSKCWDVLGNKELDIYIPSLKLAIEYNGLYWHSEIGGGKDRKYHYNKYKLCKDAGVRLIQIFEDEWEFKQDIVKNRLKHMLVYDRQHAVYARNCEIKEIGEMESSDFINGHHIQGNIPSKHRIGMYYNNELVAVMTFGSPRICLGGSNKEGCYELLRFVPSLHVIGGGSRLFQYFIRTYKPKNVISYADLRWNTGKMYEVLKMTEVGTTNPNYWYFKPGYAKRHHRYSYRKSELSKKISTFDVNLTEWQNMQLAGYDRIWDCGCVKYVINF